ncbi:MAG: Smr/MutS family protein [Chloroflexi bacterium]|nr:Smr/MutS family protein [Chloroflexota bacterium]
MARATSGPKVPLAPVHSGRGGCLTSPVSWLAIQIYRCVASVPSSTVPLELHLRRLTVDEALYRLEAYLDAAFMAGYPRVRIVHGKGTGAVKNAVWQRLANHPLVTSYALAPYGQGDAGVTVVEMEQR